MFGRSNERRHASAAAPFFNSAWNFLNWSRARIGARSGSVSSPSRESESWDRTPGGHYCLALMVRGLSFPSINRRRQKEFLFALGPWIE
jgi:hypothetical protein